MCSSDLATLFLGQAGLIAVGGTLVGLVVGLLLAGWTVARVGAVGSVPLEGLAIPARGVLLTILVAFGVTRRLPEAVTLPRPEMVVEFGFSTFQRSSVDCPGCNDVESALKSRIRACGTTRAGAAGLAGAAGAWANRGKVHKINSGRSLMRAVSKT